MTERIPSTADVYDAYRKQIEHEDELIGARNGWLTAGQAFLFGAYAAALAVQSHGAQRGFTSAAHQLFVELPVVGIVLAALVFLSGQASLYHIRLLRQSFTNLDEPPRDYPPLTSSVGSRATVHGIDVQLFPVLFVVSWIWVLASR